MSAQSKAALHVVSTSRVSDPDQELVTRAQRGDMHAWARLYMAYQPRVHRHLTFLCGNAELAEDLTQEAFARAVVDLKRFEFRSTFSTWIHAVALNIARKHWRRSQTKRRVYDRFESMEGLRRVPEDGHQATLDRDRCAVLYEVLEELPDNLREAFVLRDIEGLSTREASTLAGISPGNLAVRASRARTKIREALVARGWLED